MNKTTYSTKKTIINQTKKASLFSALLITSLSFGQTTVFSDNFNRTAVSPGGTPSTSYTTLSLTNNRTAQSSGTASFSQIVSEMPVGGTGGSPMFTLNIYYKEALQKVELYK